jgi:hypothetical protein
MEEIGGEDGKVEDVKVEDGVTIKHCSKGLGRAEICHRGFRVFLEM